MKKFFLTLVVAVASLTASAQVYVGGETAFWRDCDENTTTFLLHPEVGYNLSKSWAIGLGLGYQHSYADGAKLNAVRLDPYARYTFAKLGPVSFFTDLGFGICSYKIKDADDSNTGWRVGVQPGLKVSATKNLDFVAHVGFIGYQDADDTYSAYGDNGFGWKLSGNNLSFGLIYNF